MIFSPQSTSIEEIKVKPHSVVQVIENKPSNSITTTSTDIRPSKTQKTSENKPSSNEKIVTVVNVVSKSASPVDKHPAISYKVNIIKPSVIINKVEAPVIISSRVEEVEAATTKLTSNSKITKIEIASAPAHLPEVNVISAGNTHIPPKIIEPSVILGNNIDDPEYEFLSRQPSEVVEETYKVINFRPTSSKFILKPRQSSNVKNKGHAKKTNSIHPTGLVTKLGGTVVKDGQTTVHETSVIGTYISGKYAQVLQSSSHIISSPKGKISPTSTLKILKTAAPSLNKNNKHRHLEPTPASSVHQETVEVGTQNKIKSSKRSGGQQFKLKYRNKHNDNAEDKIETKETTPQPAYKKKSSSRSNSRNSKQNTSHRTNKIGRSNRKKTTTSSSVHSEDESTTLPTSTKRNQSNGRRNKQHRSGASESTSGSGGFSRRTFKPKIQSTAVEVSATSSLFKLKLNRSPGRWQYKTTPKPRVIIRKQNDNPANEPEYKNLTLVGETSLSHPNDNPTFSNEVSISQGQQDEANKLEGAESATSIIEDAVLAKNKVDSPVFLLETINVEISTPPDFKDVYYEIATIKSPYTFKVGSVKNTRFITVTSTFEKSLNNADETPVPSLSTAPLTENILATSSNYAKDNNFLDSSIATLPPIYLSSDMETPPLETLTETFSTTENMLKTHILPIVRNANDTSTTTLVQTYMVTRLVTATKTLPPMEAYQFIPSKTLNEFNSKLDEAGSELHLELEFGDENNHEDGLPKRVFPPDLDLANIGSKFDLSDVDKSGIEQNHMRMKKTQIAPMKNQIPDQLPTPNLSPEQLQQLAILQLFNPGIAAQPQIITTSKPVLKIETVYESHVIPITNGPNTFSTTLSKVVGTVTKTEFEYGTSTLAPALGQPLPFPRAPVNPLYPQLPQAQPQFSLTSSPVLQTTTVTQATSKVLKLTFGAKTAYTTVVSSVVVPTVLTSFVTTSVPVQPTAAFPGFFPAPFPPYPYVG
ncbi:hypothetical protein WA026_020765 [Henosepilachna vigintioctopunctata]|uniref:DUF4758 domain-containing protein n=1 Tax=Henosepilachna vigintioctopunctata TaxID=420089 RepID=A0AAW1TX99_9CUCU